MHLQLAPEGPTSWRKRLESSCPGHQACGHHPTFAPVWPRSPVLHAAADDLEYPQSRAQSRRSVRSPCHPRHCPVPHGAGPGPFGARQIAEDDLGNQPSRPCRRSTPNSNPSIRPKARLSADLVAGPPPNPKINPTDFADGVSGQGPATKPPTPMQCGMAMRRHSGPLHGICQAHDEPRLPGAAGRDFGLPADA